MKTSQPQDLKVSSKSTNSKTNATDIKKVITKRKPHSVTTTKPQKRKRPPKTSKPKIENGSCDSSINDVELSNESNGDKMPDYDSWSIEMLIAECKKYGVRQMKRERMIKTLQLIHWGVHSSDED